MIFRCPAGRPATRPKAASCWKAGTSRSRTRRWRRIAPTKANRKVKWDYDKDMYKLRNEVERLFRRLKGCRRIYTRFEKLDVMFPGFLNFALVVEMKFDLA